MLTAKHNMEARRAFPETCKSSRARFCLLLGLLNQAALMFAAAPLAKAAPPTGEKLFFIPPGFTQEGRLVRVSGETNGRLEIRTRDAATARPTACRLNVLGPDGNYYQPETNHLTPYALTGEWPKPGAWGNRPGKAPYRYLGRFFYSTGAVEISVPAGHSRIEAWKGLEFAPGVQTIEVAAGQTKSVELLLRKSADVSRFGYFSGDPHFHFPRRTEWDDHILLDLLAAEDLHFGAVQAYNEPMGPYAAFMEKLDSPQLRGLGAASIRERDGYALLSGQEYRSTTYGHLLVYLRDGLVYPGKSFNADDWPVYGEVAREVRNSGGVTIQAHGGYAQEVYADAALGTVDALELLQFGIYRGMGLADWYDMLNTGYRIPITAASDWPACRFLGDCRTFVQAKQQPSFADWLRGAARGHSFVSTGPLLLLDIDGQGPGARFHKAGPGPHSVRARIRLRCEVTPVAQAQLIVNGEAVQAWSIPLSHQQGRWFEVEQRLELREPAWIAARTWSTSQSGEPDAEAHTNPIYVYVDGRAPYRRDSLDTWVKRIEGQISVHRQREFAEKDRVLEYFLQARDTLFGIRERGGLGADELPGSAARSVGAKDQRLEGNAAVSQAKTSELSPVPRTQPGALKADEAGVGLNLDQRAVESVGQRNDSSELKRILTALATPVGQADGLAAGSQSAISNRNFLFALGRGLKHAGARLSAQDQFGPVVAQMIDEYRQIVRRVALDGRLPEPDRLSAIEQLGCLTLERVHEPLSRLLDRRQPQALQTAAIRELAEFGDPLATDILLRHWHQYTPAVRAEAFKAMLRYEDRTLTWLRAAERGEFSLRELTSSERQSLFQHRNHEVASLARKMLGASPPR
jgi:hypothetical protein